MKKISILGSGTVGQTLAAGFIKNGYEVFMGTHNPNKTIEWQNDSLKGIKLESYEEAVKKSEIVVLSVKGTVAEDVVKIIVSYIGGKTIIDTTNPISDTPPVNGVLSYFTSLNDSLMEKLQKIAPDAHFVKSFSSSGASTMVNPDFGGIRPSMFICGNDQSAKKEVSSILEMFGWDSEDMGAVEAARSIEPLAILWCIPGFNKNDWYHAFKMLKK